MAAEPSVIDVWLLATRNWIGASAHVIRDDIKPFRNGLVELLGCFVVSEKQSQLLPTLPFWLPGKREPVLDLYAPTKRVAGTQWGPVGMAILS